ncbi:MAG: hypothetical protein RLZZ417_912 [Bacteroidota bacterium]
MQVSGEFAFDIPINELWSSLLNPYYFGRLIPDIESIDKLEEETFRVYGDFNIKGRDRELSAILKILNKVESNFISLGITQEGTLGLLSAVVEFNLEETAENKTLTTYKVTIKIPFILKAIFGKKLNVLIQQNAIEFFQKLNEHLKS